MPHAGLDHNSSRTPAVLSAVHIGNAASEIDHANEALQKHCPAPQLRIAGRPVRLLIVNRRSTWKQYVYVAGIQTIYTA